MPNTIRMIFGLIETFRILSLKLKFYGYKQKKRDEKMMFRIFFRLSLNSEKKTVQIFCSCITDLKNSTPFAKYRCFPSVMVRKWSLSNSPILIQKFCLLIRIFMQRSYSCSMVVQCWTTLRRYHRFCSREFCELIYKFTTFFECINFS